MMDGDTLREELVRTLRQLSARGLNREHIRQRIGALRRGPQRFRDYGQNGDKR
jgi:hypothetical protein